ncbi:hypothetical protein ACFE04_011752 [Oxalis oulophora]
MPSISSLFTRTPQSFTPLQKPTITHFTPAFTLSIPSQTTRRRPLHVTSSLIEADGGKLVTLLVPESKRDIKKAESSLLPKIKISEIDTQWVHVLSEGWASPLRGFMRQTEFLQTLHFNSLRLNDGSIVNMSVPIVLAIDDQQKHSIGESNNVSLVDQDGNPVAILKE